MSSNDISVPVLPLREDEALAALRIEDVATGLELAAGPVEKLGGCGCQSGSCISPGDWSGGDRPAGALAIVDDDDQVRLVEQRRFPPLLLLGACGGSWGVATCACLSLSSEEHDALLCDRSCL